MPRRPTRRLRSMIAGPLTFVQMPGSKVPGSPSNNREVQTDFAFFDPKSDDFHGVKISYLDNKEWDSSGFVDLVLGQATVGTVVKIEDDEDNGLFSVVPVLDLGRYKLKNYQPMGFVLAVEADKISTFREQLHSLIDVQGL